QRFGLLHLRQRLHLLQYLRRQFAVDRDQGDSIAAGRLAADVKGGDVDPSLAQGGGELADEAWLVEVGDIDHRPAEFGVHADAFDVDDARPTVGENRSGDVARLPFRGHGHGNQTLV